MKKLPVFLVLFLMCGSTKADNLTWDLPYGIGSVGLPFQSTEALFGGDFVLKAGIAGASLPVLDIKDIVYGQLGAVGVYPGDSPYVEPYLALGIDIKRYVPLLSELKSFKVNGFGRWDTELGKPGAGISISYSFGEYQ